VVGLAVRDANAAGLRGIDLTGELLDAAAVEHTGVGLGLSGRDLTEVLDPRRIVETRTAVGGAAPSVVEGMAASCRGQAVELAALAATRTQGFAEAERVLLARAGELAGSDPEQSR